MSQAIAYAANKAGLDVEDYRGGKSQEVFSIYAESALNSIVGDDDFAFKSEFTRKAKWNFIEQNTESGQEYIVIASGAKYGHAAVVRRSGSSYQLLELQSGMQDGWKNLTEESFGSRFSVPKRSKYSSRVSVTPVASMVENTENLRAVASLLNIAG